MAESFRTESDSMGKMQVPANAYYGASTARGVENFPISGHRFPRPFVKALGQIKAACARVNADLGLLDKRRADAIRKACDEVVEGKLDSEFVLDIYQTGSGTSTNMNANEVIANRATEVLGAARGSKEVHPNDHVNMGQSSNDVIPTALHMSVRQTLVDDLVPALEGLATALAQKAAAFDPIVKIGRTHLQDATPIRLGQEFGGYAAQAALSARRAQKAADALEELALGGTAVGTGLNAHPKLPAAAIAEISRVTGLKYREAGNHFEGQAAKDACVECSGQLKSVAVALGKIANDVRWLASGPRCGIGEISIPATQPGSSIMPGKVNPVMSEALLQVCARVIGNDATVTLAAQGGVFELNLMMPVMAEALLESVRLLSNATRLFTERCVKGIVAQKDRCESLVEQSLALVTALVPKIGYDKAAAIAKEAGAGGKTVRQLVVEKGLLSKADADKYLDPKAMTEPSEQFLGAGGG
ncbi:MAG: class II fumarate hydratase [Planctomycetales bacterium]|nr:class II fumarate hydratase [Planctomycetales bacterium]